MSFIFAPPKTGREGSTRWGEKEARGVEIEDSKAGWNWEKNDGRDQLRKPRKKAGSQQEAEERRRSERKAAKKKKRRRSDDGVISDEGRR